MKKRSSHLGAIFASIVASFAAPCLAWTINARELVDVQFLVDDSLIILVSSPNAIEPGIYHWKRGADAPTKLCAIASPSSFSFDRKTIIERVAGAAPELRLYAPSSCRMLDRIKVEGAVVDADVRGNVVAVALRLPDKSNELRIYGKPTKRAKIRSMLARTETGRNVEMGFAPDGRSIVNFDLSDGGAAAWRVASLASVKLPTWMELGETTFVPGSAFVKRYENDSLSVAHWPSGALVYTIAAVQAVRLRQLSVTGRFGALHRVNSAVADEQSLDWVDFSTQKRVHLATGSIDNAAINAAGTRVAWVLRKSDAVDMVSVQLAQINVAGNAIEPSWAE